MMARTTSSSISVNARSWRCLACRFEVGIANSAKLARDAGAMQRTQICEPGTGESHFCIGEMPRGYGSSGDFTGSWKSGSKLRALQTLRAIGHPQYMSERYGVRGLLDI